MKSLFLIISLTVCFFTVSKTPIKKTKVEYIKGIDVSHHQGVIKWSKKDKKLFSFVYIKSSEGENFKDPLFKYNLNSTRKVGLYSGAYHVFNFKKNGKKQAENFIKVVPKYKNMLPPAIDLHTIDIVSEEGKINMIKELKIFNKIIFNYYGKKPIFYVSNKQYKKYLIGNFNNKIWTWHYTEKTKPSKFGKNEFSIWQYKITNSKKYKKFSKNYSLDLDYFNGDKNDFKKFIN